MQLLCQTAFIDLAKLLQLLKHRLLQGRAERWFRRQQQSGCEMTVTGTLSDYTYGFVSLRTIHLCHGTAPGQTHLLQRVQKWKSLDGHWPRPRAGRGTALRLGASVRNRELKQAGLIDTGILQKRGKALRDGLFTALFLPGLAVVLPNGSWQQASLPLLQQSSSSG